MMASLDLPLIWAGLIAFAILAYVWLDGFDLGVGILFPLFTRRSDRDLMINTIAPVWDGNETWLVMGGGGLLAVFPLAYAVILPAIYAPLIAMLLGLVFRGVAFEFRWRSTATRAWWDLAFFAGSIVATFAQGVCLGALVQGIEVHNRQYAGGWWDWLSPFSLLTGVALVVGYALLGASWLVMKTDGEVRRKARVLVRQTAWAILVLIAAVSIATPWLNPAYLTRWFSWPGVSFSVLVPALLLIAAWSLFRGLRENKDAQPFLAALAIFALCYIGLLISFYPYLVPVSLTIWEVAAPANSQAFLLVGSLVLLPMVLGYTAYAYWIFRGKTDPKSGLH